jgi:hypothetical protein
MPTGAGEFCLTAWRRGCAANAHASTRRASLINGERLGVAGECARGQTYLQRAGPAGLGTRLKNRHVRINGEYWGSSRPRVNVRQSTHLTRMNSLITTMQRESRHAIWLTRNEVWNSGGASAVVQ